MDTYIYTCICKKCWCYLL